MYDLIILGSGPAGLTAAIYAARAEIKAIVIEKEAMSGGQVINTYEVDNYPGYKGVSGFDLCNHFREHCNALGVTFVNGEVSSVDVLSPVKKVTLIQGDSYEAKSIIVATGATWRKLGIPGEANLSGGGVSYCATCDGAFFRNRNVAVVGGGDVAVEDAIFLSRICKKVYIIHRRDQFRATKVLCSQLSKLDNVQIIWNHTVEEIYGDDMVESIRMKDTISGEEIKLAVDGVFVAIGTTPNTSYLGNEIKVDRSGYIIASETCETNIPGVFAAGDIRTKGLRQIITAAADGANAVASVEKYLATIE